ncbi:MAG TPA: hypothetical protein V6C97_27605 [Oculatellaceae cyanobacterium]
MTQIRKKYLTRDQIKILLLKRIKESGLTPSRWALMHDISTTRMSFVLRDKEPPGPKLIAALGIDPEPRYAITYHIKEPTENEAQPQEHWTDHETASTDKPKDPPE